MTVFPILLIELLTLALIFLAIYRVFKALSVETSMQAVETSMQASDIRIQNNVQAHSLKEPRCHQKESASKTENGNPTELANTTTSVTKVESNQICKQTVLHNYIGDFF